MEGKRGKMKMMELKTNGLITLITELAGLACEVNERRASR